MTLQTSGAMSWANISNELGGGLPIVLPSAAPNWLAGKSSASAAVVVPTDFYGKSAVRLIGTVSNLTAQATTYTFSGVNFGLDFTGRTIIITTHLFKDNSAVLDITDVTIGGVVATGHDVGEFKGGGAPTAGAGVWEAKPTGATGDVVVTYTGGTADACIICVVAAMCPDGLFTSMDTDSGAGAGLTVATATVTPVSDGFVVGAGSRVDTSGVTFSGVTALIDQTFGTRWRVSVGFANRLPATPRVVTMTGSTNQATGFVLRAYDND